MPQVELAIDQHFLNHPKLLIAIGGRWPLAGDLSVVGVFEPEQAEGDF